MALFKVVASQEVFYVTEVEAETEELAEEIAYNNDYVSWAELGHYGEWAIVETKKIEEVA